MMQQGKIWSEEQHSCFLFFWFFFGGVEVSTKFFSVHRNVSVEKEKLMQSLKE